MMNPKNNFPEINFRLLDHFQKRIELSVFLRNFPVNIPIVARDFE